MSIDSLQSIQIFIEAAETESFTIAARHLGISPSGVSKSITRLEDKLGVRLLSRTTRSVKTTEEGFKLLETYKQIIRELEDAEENIKSKIARPSGRLRIQMPLGIGQHIISPILSKFAEEYPDVMIDLELSDRDTEMIDERLDAVIRIGDPPDSRIIARKLGTIKYIVAASPGYIKRYGAPQSPDDLERHRCLGYFIPYTNKYREWKFSTRQGKKSFMPSGVLNINNAPALIEAAEQGLGVISVANFLIYESVKTGKLVPLLTTFAAEGTDVWLTYFERRYQSPRVRALVNCLIEKVPKQSWWGIK
jgi:LysR family transcriptional regulator for bpeEF and oprC